MPIAIGTLGTATVLEFDLYLRSESSGELVLYRGRKHPFTKEDIDRLVNRGVRTLYISFGDARSYQDYVRENILKNEDIPAIDRYQALREATRDVLSAVLTNGDPPSAVEATH